MWMEEPDEGFHIRAAASSWPLVPSEDSASRITDGYQVSSGIPLPLKPPEAILAFNSLFPDLYMFRRAFLFFSFTSSPSLR